MKILTPEAAAVGVSKLGLMAFFPGDPDTRGALIHVLMEFVETDEQLDWLVERALKLYSKWPGLGELRALYCSRYRPKDRDEAYSEIYPCGFPHERSAPEFVPPPRGAPVTADAEFEEQIRAVAKRKHVQMPRAKR